MRALVRWRVVWLAAMTGAVLCAPAPASALSGLAVSGVENEPLGAGVAGGQEGAELAPVDLGDPSTQVTIAWGDGQSSTCVFESSVPTSSPAPACWFWDGEADVSSGGIFGAHAYAKPDVESAGRDVPYAWTITAPGETISGTATIADAPLTVGTIFTGGAPPPITELAGVAAPVEVAAFADADPDPRLSDYQATINWGDGTPQTAGTVGDGSGGRFEVTGSHAYAAAGTYTITTSIGDAIPGHVGYGPVQATVSATVSEAGVESRSAEEGAPFSGVIAQFCGESGSPSSVSIQWGDASPADAATTLTPGSPNCLDVSAGHTYAEGGSYAVSVTPSPSSWAAPVSGTATVADAPLTATFDGAALAAVGSSFTIPNNQLATVTDGNPDAPSCAGASACDISSTISWGDGSSSTGTVAPATTGGGLAIDGSHTFPGPGEYTISVSAHDVHGASAVASGTFTVASPPPAKAGCLSSIPPVGATGGRFGKSLAAGPPNWGVSADDRVVRFGDLVVCALDAPWTYEGAPLQTGTGGQTPGLFQTTGRIIVNGIELEPATQSAGTPYLLDTEGGGELSGPQSEGWLTQEQYAAEPTLLGDLGLVNLTSDPWVVEGKTLGVVPASSSASVDDLRVGGSLPITVASLGTVTISAAIRLPDALTLASYSGGPVTATHTFAGEYPALAPPATAPASTCGNECFGSSRLELSALIGLPGTGAQPSRPCG